MAEEETTVPTGEETPGEDEKKEVTPEVEGNKEGGEEGASDDTKGADEDVELDEDAIPVRSSASHIIARKNKQLEKLRAERKMESEDNDADDDEEEDNSLKRQVEVLTKAVVSTADENDLQGLIKEDPDAKKYEKRIRSYMNHPQYKGVHPSVIYHHLAFNEAAMAKASKKEAADFEASTMKNAGSGHRPAAKSSKGPSAEEIANMSDAEFEAMQADAMQGKYV